MIQIIEKSFLDQLDNFKNKIDLVLVDQNLLKEQQEQQKQKYLIKKNVKTLKQAQKENLSKIIQDKQDLEKQLNENQQKNIFLQEKLKYLNQEIINTSFNENKDISLNKKHNQIFKNDEMQEKAEILVKKLNQQKNEKKLREQQQRDHLYKQLQERQTKIQMQSENLIEQQVKRRQDYILQKENERQQKKQVEVEKSKESTKFVNNLSKHNGNIDQELDELVDKIDQGIFLPKIKKNNNDIFSNKQKNQVNQSAIYESNNYSRLRDKSIKI